MPPTLRDYFAAFALAGLLACPERSCPESCVEEALKAADLMLELRDKQDKG